MAIKRCRCGVSKTTQPFGSSSVTAFKCDYCLGHKERPRSHNVAIEVSSFVMMGERKEVYECKPRKKA